MMVYPDEHVARTPAALDALFGPVSAASVAKEIAYVHPHYMALIAASPFVVVATSGADGLDVSPRGDAAGFVVVQHEKTLLLPERKGNNRADSLRNLLADPRIALLFLIPGHSETLRVNGRARILTAPALLERLAVAGKPPVCVIEVTVEAVFFQCGRAMLRSRLWDAPPPTPALPTTGTILADLTAGAVGGEAYDLALPARQRATLY